MRHEIVHDTAGDGHPYCARCGFDLDDPESMESECEPLTPSFLVGHLPRYAS